MLTRLLVLFLFPVAVFAGKPIICLNMIVKDEAPVIRRCLESVKPYMDYWVIVDTGSTDGTQDIIRDFMKDIPGELHERPWVDFAHNRNEALELGRPKGDFLFFIDADEILTIEQPWLFQRPSKDYYYGTVTQKNYSGHRICMVRSSKGWFWEGVIHETLDCLELVNGAWKTGMLISADANDGHRSSDPDKTRKDAVVLEAALAKDPDSTKYTQYLAQSYYACHEYALALKYYEKRSKMGGFEEEVFFALYQVGVGQENVGCDLETCVKSFEKAFEFRPTRAEPLFHIARAYFLAGRYQEAYDVAKKGAALPYPDDINQISANIYSHGMLALLGDASYALGKYAEAKEAFEQVLTKSDTSDELRQISTAMLENCKQELDKSKNSTILQ